MLLLGAGLKYNAGKALMFSIEIGHRITFTDYIDDVSTAYPDQSLLSTEAAVFSRRSPEVDPGGKYSFITEVNQQRGDAADNDAYFFAGVLTITYTYNIRRLNIRDWPVPDGLFRRKGNKRNKKRAIFKK